MLHARRWILERWCAPALLAIATIGAYTLPVTCCWADEAEGNSWLPESIVTAFGRNSAAEVSEGEAAGAGVSEEILPDEEAPLSDPIYLGQPSAAAGEFEEFDDYGAFPAQEWRWRWLPKGVIYHSYMAGVHEPRMALVSFYESGNGRTLWDATLGGRAPFLRYGNDSALLPQGFQLDFYGAAINRLDVEEQQDLDSADYVFGFPITYGVNNWQFKLGYAHTSSHMGDEYIVKDPGAVNDRVNYVRDGIVFGTSVYVVPTLRQYVEVGWTLKTDGGAEPFEVQFGFEWTEPIYEMSWGPFLAMNGHLRQEHHFGGDVSIQAGLLRRGEYGQSLRFGAHYFNGKSSQFQFFDTYEQQVGIGLWYDF